MYDEFRDTVINALAESGNALNWESILGATNPVARRESFRYIKQMESEGLVHRSVERYNDGDAPELVIKGVVS